MAISKTWGSVLSILMGSSGPKLASLNRLKNIVSNTGLHAERTTLWHLKSCNSNNMREFLCGHKGYFDSNLVIRIGILKVAANSYGAIVEITWLKCVQHVNMHIASPYPFLARITVFSLLSLITHTLFSWTRLDSCEQKACNEWLWTVIASSYDFFILNFYQSLFINLLILQSDSVCSKTCD